MQRIIIWLILPAMLLAYACSSKAPEGEKVEAGEAREVDAVANADTLMIDSAASYVNWVATEPAGGGHNGLIRLQKGMLYVADGELKGGNFVIDMSSIDVQDLEGGRKAKLEGHLRSDDFFDAEKYPTATFTITEVEAAEDSMATHLITGNLAMRDSVKSIQIPAKIDMGGSGLAAETPKFTIDRTQWGVVHRSSVVGTVAEKLINDQLGMKVTLKAGAGS